MSNHTSNKHIAILGEKLERNRLLQDITQTELAQKAGISARTLRRFESGEGGSLDSFIRLLMALNLDSNLSILLPDSAVRPMERARPAQTERMRASRSKKSHDKAATNNKQGKSKVQSKSGWTWGDEEL